MSIREDFTVQQIRMAEVSTPAAGSLLSVSITPGSVGSATVAEQTFTVAGLVTTDRVLVGSYNTGNATGVVGARVSAANTLAVRFVNPTAGALTPGAGTYTFFVVRQQ